MGERRKRKSAWEEDDAEHLPGMNEHNSWAEKDRHSSHGSRHYHEASESRTRKSRDNSGWPAWESFEEHPIAPTNSDFKKAQDGKGFGGGKRHYNNMSPGFDGMEPRNYNDTHEYGQSHSKRYPGRGRSRSRSRSRSLSRCREREWRRSRSKSRIDVKAKDHTRIQSPINARQSYEWTDRRGGGTEKSSQICRGFSAGSCRRGSQCRFYHPNTSNRKDRDLLEEDPTENWRSRTDHNRFPKHSYSRASSGFESRNDVSDPCPDDRRIVPCKDYLRGNCRWGDTCRFSHRASSDDGYGHGSGNASFDKGKNGKPFCKFFAAGKCSRENCRFSHDDSDNDRRGSRFSHDDPDNDRRGVITTERHSHDKNNWWNGPTWDDVTTKIDDRGDESWENENKNWGKTETTFPGESGSYGRNTVSYEPIAKENENKNWEKIGSTFPGESGSYDRNTGFYEPLAKENENESWEKIESTFPGESGSCGRKMDFYEPIAKENTDNKQENLILYGSELQDYHGMENVDGENALQQNIYPASQIQQQQVLENNEMNSLGSDVHDEIKETTTHLIPFSGHQNAGSVFPGNSSISSESDRGQNVLLPNNPSNVFCADLNEPNTDKVDPLNVQTHTQNQQKASQSQEFLGAKVPELLANLLTKKLSDQVTNSQIYAEMPSFSDTSGWAPLVNTSNVQLNPGAVSIDLNSMGNGRENAEHGNLNLAQGTEHNSQIQPKQSSPLSIVGSGFDSSKVRQEDLIANSEVAGGNKVVGDESKGVEENKRFETQEGHERVEEGGANKDEKGMRLFKINLVEFVKEILKPTWKEGRMSRDDHKIVVRKVVDKVSSTIQVDHIPKTQEKVDQYLACSKPKITKLVQAYVERSLKKDS